MAVGRACCSGYRCCSIDCASCAWRYSLKITRRIFTLEPRRRYVAEITGVASNACEFRTWRKAAHNALTYRRQQSRSWSSVGFWGWWNGADVLGIAELGSVSAVEFISVFRRRGEFRLLPIDTANIRAQVYAVTRSLSSLPEPKRGRYQALKIAISPTRAAPLRTVALPVIEPMPALF